MMSPHIRLGVSPLSWTNDVLPDLGESISLETCLTQAASAGYQGIELGRKFPRTHAELAPLLHKAGLQLASGWHSGFLAERGVADEIAAVESHAALLRALGAEVMVYGECGCMPGSHPLDQPLSLSPSLSSLDADEYARKVSRFADILMDRFGLKLAYHHHLMMLVEQHHELEEFLIKTSDSVGLVLDSGHAFAAGVNLAQITENFGHRIVHIHLKDVRADVLHQVLENDLSFNDAVRAGLFTVPGEGCIDYSPLTDFIAHADYQGWLIVEAEQDPQKEEPSAAVSRAFQWVKNSFSPSLSAEETVQ
ncbi:MULTISPECIES: myo-inosose-2 dehydratase [unclassified Pantoea]|uniref:myo-inosose-2 dehydratase n=1 Tax=unclassified Pantoea TaxID=2630326 RepID=UPI001232791E|nr:MULTISPECIES: myo-inosose-2 dehydratase [unclassified Pantoea]KAA5974389.1 myo-inosose-2 dehydratase [Pantoea sp. M_6]KAA5978349.1 myo-inosose-2 dehydratase [Pantoea sp. M_8]KAA5989896.1 myo-inosose-2 dehydratase [Pantoea sp. M_10]KAA6002873.1 myo-inosose-2 dehydratase [Pantoea sp. M_5]